MKFTPTKFQGSLAAAGMSLMPFNFLKTSVFKGGDFSLTGLSSQSFSGFENITAYMLTGLMAMFIAIHIVLTLIFLKELLTWLFATKGFFELMKNPLGNSAIFSPLISLPMSMVVLMGPLGFFFPWIGENLQSLMVPAIIFFMGLWFTVISLEVMVLKTMFQEKFDHEKLNFAWLLDILAFGAISLFGSGLATSAANEALGSAAAFMTMFLLLVGIVAFGLKLALLFYQEIRSHEMPDTGVVPAYFLVIPPMCLLWFSFYKIMVFSGKTFGFDISAISFIVIVLAYVTTMLWLVFLLVFLNDYLRDKFLTSKFSPAQWGMV